MFEAAIDGAAPICSTANQAKVLLSRVQELHVQPFKFMLLGLSGKYMIYKKWVNIISSNIMEGHG
jgi:hypothetical protein